MSDNNHPSGHKRIWLKRLNGRDTWRALIGGENEDVASVGGKCCTRDPRDTWRSLVGELLNGRTRGER